MSGVEQSTEKGKSAITKPLSVRGGQKDMRKKFYLMALLVLVAWVFTGGAAWAADRGNFVIGNTGGTVQKSNVDDVLDNTVPPVDDTADTYTVTFSGNPTAIGSMAFNERWGLTGVTIPDSVVTIENYAFYSCSSLTELTLPAGLQEIEYVAFGEVSWLETVTLLGAIPPANIDIDAFDNAGVWVTSVKVIVPKGSKAAYETALAGLSNFIFTVEEAPDTTINLMAIGGVKAPATAATPVKTITETAQYSGVVTWKPADNPFGYKKVYTATITLKPKTGYTLSGVAANSFTVAGAKATNPANSGVISAVFPATGGDGGGDGDNNVDGGKKGGSNCGNTGVGTFGTLALLAALAFVRGRSGR